MGRMIITKKDIAAAVQPPIPWPPPAPPAPPSVRTAARPKTVPAAAAAQQPDEYRDKLLKYIPGEAVALYLTVDGLVKALIDPTTAPLILWIFFIVGLVGAWLYQWRLYKVTKPIQLAISTVAFAVWVFALGGPFAYLSWYVPGYGSLLIVLYTFLIPLVDP